MFYTGRSRRCLRGGRKWLRVLWLFPFPATRNPTLDAGGWQLHCWTIFYIHLLVEQNITPFHFISIESHD